MNRNYMMPAKMNTAGTDADPEKLVYFVTALRSNEMLLMKMRADQFPGTDRRGERILNDLIVDNSQALEMANIYTNILNSTLDAFCQYHCQQPEPGLKRGSDHHRDDLPGTDREFVRHECTQWF